MFLNRNPLFILESLVFSSVWTLSLSEEGVELEGFSGCDCNRWRVQFELSETWIFPHGGQSLPHCCLWMFSLHSGCIWEILTPSFTFIITHEPFISLYLNTISHFGLNLVLFSSGKLPSRSEEKRSWVEEKKEQVARRLLILHAVFLSGFCFV